MPYSSEGSHHAQSTLKAWGIMLLLPEGSVYINYLEFFHTGDLSLLSYLFIHSIIYLYQHRLMDINFILWVIIQYYCILLFKSFQFGPLGALQLAPVPLWHAPHHYEFFCFQHFLPLWHYKMLQAHLYIFCCSLTRKHKEKRSHAVKKKELIFISV